MTRLFVPKSRRVVFAITYDSFLFLFLGKDSLFPVYCAWVASVAIFFRGWVNTCVVMATKLVSGGKFDPDMEI